MNRISETFRKSKTDFIILIIYIVSVSVVSYFHEPWFDEAQAWQIAKCASIKEIFFEIPHFEGHPQLWHLLLVPFAKNGMPFEITMSAINIFFCSVSAGLVLFKSPFPNIIKRIIPFTYFFFYQYAVICRPYCIAMLALILMGMTYNKRNEKPIFYVISLALLCLSHSYGIVLAGGTCIVWLADIIKEYLKQNNLKEIIKDKRCHCLAGLAVLAVLLIISIIPDENVYYAYENITLSERFGNIYLFFDYIYDALFGSVMSYKNSEIGTSTVSVILGTVCGIALFTGISFVVKKTGRLMEFVLPYTMLAVFMIAVYSYVQHIGIVTIFILYIFWTSDSEKLGKMYIDLKDKILGSIQKKSIVKLLKGAIFFVMIVPVMQSAVSSFYDIKYNYSASKQAVEFLCENGLENLKIMTPWTAMYDFEDEEEIKDMDVLEYTIFKSSKEILKYRKDYVNINSTATLMLAYLENNTIINFNSDDKDAMYTKHMVTDTEKAFSEWRKQGMPDILVGVGELSFYMVYDADMNEEYAKIAVIEHGKIWKFTRCDSEMSIYIKRDLLSQYPQLEEIKY